jgi:hypothetical protein
MVFQRLLCTEYESRFMALSSNKQVAIRICMDMFEDDHSVCGNGHQLTILYKSCVTKMTNILLNNYCKKLNDAAISAKGQISKDKKSRKLSTLTKT